MQHTILSPKAQSQAVTSAQLFSELAEMHTRIVTEFRAAHSRVKPIELSRFEELQRIVEKALGTEPDIEAFPGKSAKQQLAYIRGSVVVNGAAYIVHEDVGNAYAFEKRSTAFGDMLYPTTVSVSDIGPRTFQIDHKAVGDYT